MSSRISVLLLCCGLLSALDNSVTIHNWNGSGTGAARKTNSTEQTNRPFSLPRWFARGEIANYPKPFVDGSAPGTWQADCATRWDDNSAKFCIVSFRATVPANNRIVVDFRSNSVRCNLADDAACDNAGLTQQQILDFNGGNWGACTNCKAYPQGSTTESVADMRAMVSAGRWSYWLRGPAVTAIVARDVSSAFADTFGWKDRRFTTLASASISSTASSFTVFSGADLANIARPFTVQMRGDGGSISENISVCFVSGNTVYVGTTDGPDASCANVAGRGQHGTTAATHWAGASVVSEPHTRLAAAISTSATSFDVVDGGALGTPPFDIRVNREYMRVTGKTGNTLTVTRAILSSTPNTHQAQAFVIDHDAIVNAGTKWVNAPNASFRSLLPVFTGYFYAGESRVRVIYEIENTLVGRRQDQIVSVELRTGSTCNTLKYSKTDHKINAKSRRSKAYWDGTEPGDVRIDFNTPYLLYSKAIPSFDPRVINQVPSTTSHWEGAIDSLYSTWLTGDKGEWGGTGGSTPRFSSIAKNYDCSACDFFEYGAEIGVLQRIHAMLAMAQGQDTSVKLWDIAFGTGLHDSSAALSGGGGFAGIDEHHGQYYREARTASPPAYCGNSCTGDNLTVSSVGRPFSIDAYPSGQTILAEPDTIVGLASSDFWSSSAEHRRGYSFLPWLFTGEPRYREGLILRAHAQIALSNPCTGPTTVCRQSWWGHASDAAGSRFLANYLRDVTFAWAAAPDGSAEQEYLRAKIENNIATREGMLDIRDGRFAVNPDCPNYSAASTDLSNRWCWGRKSMFNNEPNALGWIFLPSFGNSTEGCSTGGYNCALAFQIIPPWIQNRATTMLNVLADLGFGEKLDKIRPRLAESLIQQIRTPGVNPAAIFSQYRQPARAQLNAPKLIDDISKESNALITVAGHGFSTGDYVALCCPSGTGWVNAKSAGAGQISSNLITVVDANSFRYQTARNTSTASGTWNQTAHVVKTAPGAVYQSWADVAAASFDANAALPYNSGAGGTIDHNFFAIPAAGLAGLVEFSSGTVTGSSAWEWAEANYYQRIYQAGNPKWFIVPRQRISNIRRVGNSLLFTAPDGAACSWANNPASTLDSGDTGIPAGGRHRSIDVTGLNGTIRITCGTARLNYSL